MVFQKSRLAGGVNNVTPQCAFWIDFIPPRYRVLKGNMHEAVIQQAYHHSN
jgi:hypothetical protein